MGGPDENGHGFSDGFDESEDVESDELVIIHDGESERECVVLAVAEMNGQEYALLAPANQLNDVPEDEEEGELELFIFAYSIDDEGQEIYQGIEDEAIFDQARAFFSTLIDTDEEEEDVN